MTSKLRTFEPKKHADKMPVMASMQRHCVKNESTYIPELVEKYAINPYELAYTSN